MNKIYPLDSVQKRFLKYVLHNHKGIGWTPTLKIVIERCAYTDDERSKIIRMISSFKELRNCHYNDYFLKTYKRPTKYLK